MQTERTRATESERKVIGCPKSSQTAARYATMLRNTSPIPKT